MNKTLVLALLTFLTPMAYADQGGFYNSGGSTQISSGVIIHSTVATPPGTLTINCPTTAPARCAGGSFTYASNDGTMTLSASFTSATFTESCSGGGRGGHVTCGYSFSGYMSGTWSLNGAAQAVNGVTYQGFRTGGAAATGTTVYNSAYSPFYYSDTEQIHRSDDLQGTNQISFGGQGSDVGQFYGAYGIALDSAGRIYVADTYNCRIVRIDDMNGTNWTSFGIYGSDIGQFSNPSGISIDAAGGIYVMDTGNSRLVRMDDMNGTNWTTFSGTGSGVGQFAQYASPVAFDASGRIYVADTGNTRIVRMDDMSGANWATLTQSPVIYGYIFSFASPMGVAVDAAGRIYVADGYRPAVVRVDDMTGTNWTSISLGSSATPNSIAIDSSGIVLVGGGGAQIVDNMAVVLASSSALTQFYGPYYVFGATPIALPTPRPSAIGFSPPTLTFSQNMGATSAAQTITITNFGGSPLNGLNLAAGGGFSETNNCPAALSAGSNCTASVAFTPQVVGPVTGALMVTDDSGNLGSTQAVPLDGTGTTPGASVTPTTLFFPSQAVGTTSTAKNITLQSTGTGPLQVTSIVTAAPFSQTNNCSGSIAPAASCTIQVTFAPTAAGSASGSVTITDNAGTQTVGLTGGRSAEPD